MKMKLDNHLFDQLSNQAKVCERLRMSYDLRNAPNDNSQRILNALELGTKVPIHRHRNTSETVIVLRGCLRELFFNANGDVIEEFSLKAGTDCAALQIPAGQWHSLEVVESNTIIFEGKDGVYMPLDDEDILQI